jgi:hypothetical protein
MPKKPTNSGKTWTDQDVKKLQKLIKGNTPTGLIAHDLGRSESSIYKKASDIGASVKPVNQSPYGPRKKKK